jgi:hypothetical protein
MKFNELATLVLENVVSEEVESRKPNPEFQAWKSSQKPEFISSLKNPYTYWYLKVKGKSGGSAAPLPGVPVADNPKDTEAPVGVTSDSVLDPKTQEAVDDYMSGNPGATVEDVIAHLTQEQELRKDLPDADVQASHDFDLDPVNVQRMMDASKDSDLPVADAPVGELDAVEAAKKAKFDRLRKFMKMNRAEREAFLARAKDKLPVDDEKDEEESEEDDGDPYVKHYLKGMKGDDDSIEDPDAEDYEGKED